ncbi:GntR family transcriptional regulator [soil metagenome]|nr:GntR family transcriptional regulator [Trueperaceae bacterium]
MQTKQDHAYHVLKEHIAKGLLLPGQRIVVNRFAGEIGTSAVPVREALLRLEAEGLVTITPHVGAVVTHITGERIEMTLEALAVLEGYATRQAAARANEILPELKGHHGAMAVAAHADDWESFSRENRAFHFLINTTVVNAVVAKTIGELWSQLDTCLSASAFYLMPDRALTSVDEHAQIIAMLEDPLVDLDALESLARTHKFNTAKRLHSLKDGTQPRVSFSVPS